MIKKNEKIITIARYLTNDPDEFKKIIKDINKSWFDIQINSAFNNIKIYEF